MYKKINKSQKSYPSKLRHLSNAPEFIHYIGNPCFESPSIGVVGSRQMTEYGKQVVQDIVYRLFERKIVVVSGLASGIDKQAHSEICKLDGKTIGVLGFGMNYLSKRSSEYEITKKIVNNKCGVVVSPFDLSQRPHKYTYINRNKILAGLSDCVIVIEAVEKSGTFHTVEASLELGRDVFAVPGNIFSKNSRGTHLLIKSGAKLVDCIEDIVVGNFDN